MGIGNWTSGSRNGDMMLVADYGETIWQWDERQ